jgi:D-alanyl-D-alanine dipeptidase
MQAGAIDINIFDKNGNNLNKKDPQLVEDIMCEYGFVRWHSEDWHFEYGTNAWDNAVEKRLSGEKSCTY